MSKAYKRVLLSNQEPAVLHRDIARAFIDAGIPIAQMVTDTGWQLDDENIPTKLGRKRDISSGLRRLWTWFVFSMQAFWMMIKNRKGFGLLVTNPPLVPWIAPLAKWLFGFRYGVIMYDLYPDVMVSAGMLAEGSLTHRLFKWVNGVSLRNAEVIITLGRGMKKTTEACLGLDKKTPIHVVHNWVDIDEIRPIAKGQNTFAQAHDLVDKFVVMYSGNWSPTHGLDLVIELADELSDREDLQFMLIGDGVGKADILADIERRGLTNVKTLPYLSQEVFRSSIASADCQIISLDKQYYGISMPSKTYTALSAGCALLAITPEGTELEAIVTEHDCGRRIPARDIDALRDAVLGYYNDRELLARHKANARKLVDEKINATSCTGRYVDIIRPFL